MSHSRSTRMLLLGLAATSLYDVPAVHAQQERVALEEVVVTARRREELQQNIPITITALTPDALNERGIDSAWDLQKAVPSLLASTTGTSRNSFSYSMRGQSAAYGATVAPVVVYFADVPLTGGTAAPFYDLANVQSLSGPQGTLFGRNSTGGAILFQPKRPEHQLEGYATVKAGNLSYREYEAMLNLPVISDTLAIRIAGNAIRRDGFTKDLTTGEDLDNRDEENWRIGVLFTPTDSFENYLVYDHRKLDQNGTSYLLYETDDPNPVIQQALADQQARGVRRVASTPGMPASRETADEWGISNSTTLDLGAITLKNILGYRRTKPGLAISDTDGSPLPLLGGLPRATLAVPGFTGSGFPDGSKALTEELQIIGSSFDERLDWMVGGFYSRTEGEMQVDFYYSLLLPPPNPPVLTLRGTNGFITEDESRAIFGQATLDLSDWISGLSVTAGYRYTRDEREATATVTQEIFGLPMTNMCALIDGAPLSDCSLSLDRDFSASSWTISAEYQLTPDMLVYLAHRRGYKAGGINMLALPPQVGSSYQFYDPENVDDIELGLKLDWNAGGMGGRFNLALYRSWYEDIQRSIDVVPTSFTANAAKATIDGVELQAVLIPAPNLELSAFYSYTDASYDAFANPITGQQAAGNAFAFVPKEKAGFSARYSWELGNLGVITPSISYSWQDEYYFTDFSNAIPTAVVPSYGLVDARIDWADAFGTPLDITLFGRNLSDKEYIVNGNRAIAGLGRVFYGEPRTYGLELRYTFGN